MVHDSTKFAGLFVVLWIAWLVSGCAESKNSKGMDGAADFAKIAADIDSIGTKHLHDGQVVGFSIAVMQQGDTLYNRSFGHTDSARSQPITNQHRFKLASISKLVTATLIMKLAEEEILSLDQSLYELLPDFPNPAQARKIQLRHLLSHTSGLPEYSAVIDTLYRKNRITPGKKDFYDFFRGRDLVFEPGSHYSYCNSGFLLAGLIIERITGNELQEEINRIVNAPTGMHLELVKTAASHPAMSPYFEWIGSTLHAQPLWTWLKGDGGLTTTALELAHFPMYWSSGKIIRKESWQQMCEPFVLNDGVRTGYGLGVRNGLFENERMLGHTGGNYTPLSIMAWFPDRQISIVVMVNTDNTPGHVRRIFAPVAQVVLGKAFPDYGSREVPTPTLSNYVGTYSFVGYKAATDIFVKLNSSNGHLYYYEGPKDTGKKMTHLGKGEFWIDDWPYDRLYFEEDAGGNVRALKEYYSGFYVVLRKKTSD